MQKMFRMQFAHAHSRYERIETEKDKTALHWLGV